MSEESEFPNKICIKEHRAQSKLLSTTSQRTRETIRRIADHLGVVYTSQLIDEIAEAVDINRMKTGKAQVLAVDEAFGGMSSSMVLLRKGKKTSSVR